VPKRGGQKGGLGLAEIIFVHVALEQAVVCFQLALQSRQVSPGALRGRVQVMETDELKVTGIQMRHADSLSVDLPGGIEASLDLPALRSAK
jgi:hypothetical protein